MQSCSLTSYMCTHEMVIIDTGRMEIDIVRAPTTLWNSMKQHCWFTRYIYIYRQCKVAAAALARSNYRSQIFDTLRVIRDSLKIRSIEFHFFLPGHLDWAIQAACTKFQPQFSHLRRSWPKFHSSPYFFFIIFCRVKPKQFSKWHKSVFSSFFLWSRGSYFCKVRHVLDPRPRVSRSVGLSIALWETCC